jgi:hypothetical protein
VNDLKPLIESPGKLRLPSSYSHLEFFQQDLRVSEDEIQTKVKKLKEQKFPTMQKYQTAASESTKSQELGLHNQ